VDDINNRFGRGTVSYAGGRISGIHSGAFGFGASQRIDVAQTFGIVGRA
jgi:hypothetical protein